MNCYCENDSGGTIIFIYDDWYYNKGIRFEDSSQLKPSESFIKFSDMHLICFLKLLKFKKAIKNNNRWPY